MRTIHICEELREWTFPQFTTRKRPQSKFPLHEQPQARKQHKTEENKGLIRYERIAIRENSQKRSPDEMHAPDSRNREEHIVILRTIEPMLELLPSLCGIPLP
jgi:hypothetical protein